jgi:hypothetical protein
LSHVQKRVDSWETPFCLDRGEELGDRYRRLAAWSPSLDQFERIRKNTRTRLTFHAKLDLKTTTSVIYGIAGRPDVIEKSLSWTSAGELESIVGL